MEIVRLYVGENQTRHKPVIDWDESETIKLIFQLADDGLSTYRIRQELLKRQITPPRPNVKVPWRASTIRTTLRNRSYLGSIDWTANTGEKFTLEIPQLIDLAQFNRVQAQLTANKKLASRNTKTIFLIQPLAYCHHCGAKICATTRRFWYGRQGEAHEYKYPEIEYRCHNTMLPESDHNSSWGRGSKIDERVWAYVSNELFSNDELLSYYVDESVISLQADLANIDEQIADAQTKKTRVEHGRKALINQLTRGYITESEFEAEITETQNELDHWTVEIEHLTELKEQQFEAEQTRTYTLDLIKQMKESVKDLNQTRAELEVLEESDRNEILTARQQIIRAVIERIELDPSGDIHLMGGVFDDPRLVTDTQA